MTGCTTNKTYPSYIYEQDLEYGYNTYKYGWYCTQPGTKCDWFSDCRYHCYFSKRNPKPTATCHKYPHWSKFGVDATPDMREAAASARTACDITAATLKKYQANIPNSLMTATQAQVNKGKKLIAKPNLKSNNPAKLLYPTGTDENTFPFMEEQCKSYTRQILSSAIDNCSNQTTLIDSNNTCLFNSPMGEGMTTMREGFDTKGKTLNQVYNETLNANVDAYETSQNALNSIKPGFAAPQLKNQSPNPNPTDVNYKLYGYSNYTMGDDTKTLEDVRKDLKEQMDYSPNIYNNCSNSYSLLDMTGVKKCLPNYYNPAKSECTYANNLAIQFKDKTGGMKKIPKLWADAENSLHGNSLYHSQGILTNVENSCKNWVQMYDKWQEDEQQAEEIPCVPERPIEPSFNPAIQKIVENWTNASEKYIESLMERLRIIEKYIETYPNILELNGKNVNTLPPGQPPYFTIRRIPNPKTSEISPTFSLNIDIPEGQKGVKGIAGKMGSTGPRGVFGTSGPRGLPGKSEEPIQFKNIVTP